MPDFDEFDEIDDEDQNSAPAALRSAFNKAKKQNAELAKKLEELTKKLATQSLDGLLRDKKVPANIQRWMKRDEVEPTAEAVDQWLEENGADFGWKPGEPEPAPEATKESHEVESQVETHSVLSEEDIQAYLRQQALGQEPSQALSLDPVKSAVDNVAANISLDTDPAVVARMLQEAGIPVEGQVQY